MTAAALNFKEVSKGSIRGFFDLRYYGLTIRGCRLMSGPNGHWVALPQQKVEKDGQVKWLEQLSMSTPELDHVKKLVIADLTAQGHCIT